MGKTLNFTTMKKQYLTVTLPDGHTIMVSTPTKKVLSELVSLQESLEDIQSSDATLEDMDNLFSTCAKIMSCNKANEPITKTYLEDILDFQDVIIFFQSYTTFIGEVMRGKN